MTARFITFEGSEGAGKTTQLNTVKAFLEGQGQTVVVTREPGGTPLAERIRDLLLDSANETMCDDTELLLMFAARAQHISEVIQPALARGDWVLSDRFTDASFAYQGGGRGLSAERIAQLAEFVQGDLEPQMTLLFDLPIEVGMERARARGRLDRFERSGSEFFERVRQAYLAQAQSDPNRIQVIDAAQDLESVTAQVEAMCQRLI